MSAFLKLDVFRSLPKDLTEPTFCGGISKFILDFNQGLTTSFYYSFTVSMICSITLILLTVTEVRNYIMPQTQSQISIQSSHEMDKFKINLDIVMPRMPCDVIGLNVEDSMNNRVSDYYGELHKHRLDKNGRELSVETWEEKSENRRAVADRVERELKE